LFIGPTFAGHRRGDGSALKILIVLAQSQIFTCGEREIRSAL
jgi:hypothetical protein